MYRRIIQAALVLGLVGVTVAEAQICTTSHTTDLYCLLPAAFHTTAAPFNSLYAPFGTELSQLPRAKPAGLILELTRGVLTPTSESLGAVFSERAETIGKRVFLGVSYQHFNFSELDGNALKSLPIILTYATPGDVVYTVTTDRIDIKSTQYTFLGTMGLTKRIDVSLSLPVQRIALSAGVKGTEYEQRYGATAPVTQYYSGYSSGVGDLIAGLKGILWQGNTVSVAAGTDVRLPTGDELNFLGSGTIGIKPYLAVSRNGRVSPHGNLGYQWNGASILNPDSQGQAQRLPPDLFYTLGFDTTVSKHLTFVADLLGDTFLNAPRLSAPVAFPVVGVATTPFTVLPYTGKYTTQNLGLGIKSKAFVHLVFTGNVLLKLNHAGLRATAVPLVGLSYSF